MVMTVPLGSGSPFFAASTAAGVTNSSRYCLLSARSTVVYITPCAKFSGNATLSPPARTCTVATQMADAASATPTTLRVLMISPCAVRVSREGACSLTGTAASRCIYHPVAALFHRRRGKISGLPLSRRREGFQHGCTAISITRDIRPGAAAQPLLQSRSAAPRHESARARRHRRHHPEEHVLSDGLQRHRAQIRRAAALCDDSVAARARAPDRGPGRLLSRDFPDAAELGRGHPPVPRGDDAARPAAAARRHRSLHSGARRIRTLDGERAQALCLRHG